MKFAGSAHPPGTAGECAVRTGAMAEAARVQTDWRGAVPLRANR